jgi:hypothetical protein
VSSTRTHWQAVLELVPADLRLYRGDVPANPAYPYVLAWSGLSSRDAVTLCGQPTNRTHRIRTTIAGLNEDSVMIVQDRVRDALDRAVPQVPGWSREALRLVPLSPVLEDLSVSLTEGRHPFFTVDEYELVTAPL